ncbi:MAG: amidohydrolase family protein [Thermoplasmata archaeon]|nr:amidohydrolase family protein [Thermoplasmata archaeon]
MQYVSGLIYKGEDGFVRGSLGFEEGFIREVNEREEKRALARGIVIPNFFDAHTHIGDSIVREEVRGSVEEVFGPEGFKISRLRAASDENLVDSIRVSLRNMVASGISGFCDFRENGVKGLSSLYLALFNSPVGCIALGRPDKNIYDEKEIGAILNIADGIGASSARDWDFAELEKVRALVEKSGKMFATHASEDEREDIDRILRLNPKFLVHMTNATNEDLEVCAEKKIPIVVCPRSNAFFGSVIDLRRMLDSDVFLMLGTDNFMLNSPSLLSEMEFAYRLSKVHGGLSCKEIFKLGMNARTFFQGEEIFEAGQKADFMVLDSLGPLDEVSKDPYYHIVLRSTEANIALVCMGEHVHSRANINK